MRFEPSFTAGLGPQQWILLAALGLAAFLVVLYLSLRLPLRILMGIVLIASILQVFGPLGFTSGALLFTAALAPGLIVRTRRSSRDVWFWLLAALIVWQGISVLWSFKFGSAAYGVVSSIALLAAYMLARGILNESKSGLRSAAMIALPVVAIEAVMMIAFRVAPELENWYLALPLARVFSEPGVEVLFSGGYENVVDPGKSGGTLLNGNTASLLMAVCACVYLLVACGSGGKWLPLSAASLCVVAMFATGSKTPLALSVALLMAALVILIAVRKPARAALLLAGGIAATALAVWLVVRFKPDLLEETVRTSGERGVLWGLVIDSFPEHWFLGFGYGNWREFMIQRVHDNPQLVGDPTLRVLPPHNLFAQAWVDAGLIALLLVAVLAVVPIGFALLRIWRERTAPITSLHNLRLAILLVGVAWPIAHGLTDTTQFYGDNHTIPWYAILVAATLARPLAVSDAKPEGVTARQLTTRDSPATDLRP